jgi:predicted phosphodiesterase
VTSNRILFAGDPHGNFKAIVKSVLTLKPKAVIILGDFGLTTKLEIELEQITGLISLFWIPGNHDYDSPTLHSNLFESGYSANNLDGRVVDICDLKVAGLGGVFKGKVWHPDEPIRWKRREDLLHFLPSNVKKQGLPRHHEAAIWYEDYERLSKQQADILVTHEAPSCHPHGFIEIDLLAEMMGVKQIFHGHHHQYYSKILENGIQVCGAPISGVVDSSGNLLEEKL